MGNTLIIIPNEYCNATAREYAVKFTDRLHPDAKNIKLVQQILLEILNPILNTELEKQIIDFVEAEQST